MGFCYEPANLVFFRRNQRFGKELCQRQISQNPLGDGTLFFRVSGKPGQLIRRAQRRRFAQQGFEIVEAVASSFEIFGVFHSGIFVQAKMPGAFLR